MNTQTVKHVVIAVHGIRTFGEWQERLQSLVKEEKREPTFYRYKFGYFSLLAFATPPLRWLVVRRFRRELRAIISREHPDRLDLIGHSFGTWLIAYGLRGLAKAERPAVHTIILAGSVLRSDFYWADLLGTSVKRVINDCGAKDAILLLSQVLVLFTGMAGRTGFAGVSGGDQLENRYSNFGHSGYFRDKDGRNSDTYMKSNWLPLILGDGGIPGFDERKQLTASKGAWMTVANNLEPIKILLYLTPLLVLAIYWGSLYIKADLAKQRLDSVFDLADALKSKGRMDESNGATSALSTIQRWASLPLKRTYILWVDDNPSSVKFERLSFSRFGICFELALNTADAIKLIRADADKYSLVISDFRRDADPQSGYGLLDKLKELQNPIPLIFYVGKKPSDATVADAIKRGASAETNSPVILFNLVFDTINPTRVPVGQFRLVAQELFDRCDT